MRFSTSYGLLLSCLFLPHFCITLHVKVTNAIGEEDSAFKNPAQAAGGGAGKPAGGKKTTGGPGTADSEEEFISDG